MSQGTPSREGRIERHLMRQRGAGVREITADFGFSFALPTAPPIAQFDIPTEPPKKRRKTNESTSPKRCSIVTTTGTNKHGPHPAELAERLDERITAQPEPHPERTNDDNKITITTTALPSEQVVKPPKKATRVRRKLCLDDEIEQKAQQDDGEAPTGGLEDTFIFGLKPKKRQPRRKLEDEAVPVTSKGTTKKAPAKGRKANKAKQQTEDKRAFGLAAEPPLEIVILEENVDEGCVSELPKETFERAPAKKKKGTKAKLQAEGEHMSGLAAEPFAKAVVPEENTEKATASEASKQAPKKATKAKQQTEDVHMADSAAEAVVPEKNTEKTTDPEVAKQTSKKAPCKGNKAAKVKRQAEDEPVHERATEPPADFVVPEKKMRAGRKKPVTNGLVAIVSTGPNTFEEAATINKAEPGPGDFGNPPPVAKTLDDETADAKSKPPQATSATKRAHKRSIDEVISADTPEETTKRPRRQAAISANQKVTLSYEEDLVPVDKLRRAPDIGRRSRKANPREPSASPQTMRSVSAIPQTLSGGVDRLSCSPLLPVEISEKAAVKSAEAYDHRPEEQLDPQAQVHESHSKNEDRVLEEELSSNLPKIPARRGRKLGAKAAETAAEEASASIKLPAKRGPQLRVKAAEPTSEAPPQSEKIVPAKRGRKAGVKAAGPASYAPPLPEKAAATRSLSATVKATKATPETIDVESPNVVLAIEKTILAAVGPQESVHKVMDVSAKATEKSVVVAEQEPRNKPVQEQPKKARRALADFDSNIARHAVTAESKKQLHESTNSAASPPAKQQSRSREIRTKPSVVPDDIGRHSKAQSVQQRELPTDNKPFRGTPISPRKHHVISAEEDLDWLFEKPETKRSQPIRHSAPKTRRKDADQNAKDMDLDDLLASIAGFSGKLLTGKRGHAVAS